MSLWGNLSKGELKKFGILAFTLFVIIGTYWMLRVMKNATFDLFVGYDWQPIAKLVSLVCVAFVVLFYSKLVDLFTSKTLFWIICLTYGIGFMAIAYGISLYNAQEGVLMIPSLGRVSGRGLGWFSYLFLESFGSIVPALFWSFVSSTTTTESAKRGYGMIMSVTQVGVIVGPLIVAFYSKKWGLPVLWCIGAILICLVPLIITLYSRLVPQEIEQGGQHVGKKKTGMFEGLKLLLSRSYLMGILVVVTMYEVISTIVEFQMNMLIKQTYPSSADGGAMFAALDAYNGVCIGILSFVFALLGSSYFMRKYGLKFCLVSFPVMIGITLVAIYWFHMFGAIGKPLMWICFAAVIIIKGLNYALNVPTKEVLYIPTSKDAKFKAKGWIDAFGNRSAKAVGAGITSTLGRSLSVLISYGTFISLAILAFWIMIARFVGNKFKDLQDNNEIVE